MTTRSSTTKEALEPVTRAQEWLADYDAGKLTASDLYTRCLLKDLLTIIDSRTPAPIVAPEVDESWFDLALRYLRGDPALTDVPYSDDSVFADFLRFWDAQTPHFRSVIGSVFRAAPKFTAPASTVAPQQSVHAFIPPAGAMCVRCGLSILAHQTAPASPAALRDEADTGGQE